MTWPLCWPLCRWWRWSRVSLRLTGWKAWCLAGRWVASGHFFLSCCVHPEVTLCDWPDIQIQELINLSCPVVSIVCVDGVFLCGGRFAALLWLCLLKGVTLLKEWLWLCWIYSKIVTMLWPCKKESERWKKVLLFESCQKESDCWEEELPERVWLLTESGAVDRKKVTDERKSDCWEGEVPERVWLLTESSCWQKQCDHWEGELPVTVWLLIGRVWLLTERVSRKQVTVIRRSVAVDRKSVAVNSRGVTVDSVSRKSVTVVRKSDC